MEYLSGLWLGMPIWVWMSFLTIVVIILAIDLGLFHREAHEPSMREALSWLAPA
jgi:tellurite resistance protein TerC